MNVKMNTKLRLIMEVITVLYLFLSALLKNLDTNIPILLTFIWIAIWCIIFLNGKRLGGITDELVISILSKINRVVVYFLLFAIGIFSGFLVTPYNNSIIISKVTIGIYLIFILLIATVIRLLLFIYYDRKGIYK